MEAQINYAPTAWAMLLLLLLTLAACAAAGLMLFAVFRKRGTLTGGVVLLGLAGVGLCLLLYLFTARRADVRQQAHIHQLDAITTEMEAMKARSAESPGFLLPIGTEHEIRARENAESLPEWVTAHAGREGDRMFVVVSGQQFADSDRAERDALSRAIAEVSADFMRDYRPWGNFVLHPEQVREIAVRRSHTETIERTAGENAFTVYRTYLQVELSDETRHQVETIWKEQAGMQRSVTVAGVLAMLTAIAGVVAGYFRLDDRTGGRRRWQLRLGALAATLLIGGTLLAGTRLVSNAVQHRPVDVESQPEPVEAPLPMARRVAPFEPLPPAPVAPPQHVIEVLSFDCPN